MSRLEQGYVVCSSDQRFLLLYTFLKKNIQKKKIMWAARRGLHSQGVLLELQLCSVPRGAAELHRHPGHVHPRKAEAAATLRRLLRVRQRQDRRAALHRRRGARPGHSGGGLDHPVRPARRPQGVHSSRGTDGARKGGRGTRFAVSAAVGRGEAGV